jgi:hypothetical protein
MARKPRLPRDISESARAAEQAKRHAAKGLRQAERLLSGVASSVASEWRRVLKSEDAAANAANRYILRTVEAYSPELTIAERQFRKLQFGVTVEKAIEERRVRLRPYASQSTQRAAERAIERNEKNPIRAQIRRKRQKSRKVSEREFRAQDKWFRDAVEKKSGVRWRWDKAGKLISRETGRNPVDLTPREFNRASNFYHANEDLYEPMQEDLFRRAGGFSPVVRRKAHSATRRAA